MRIHTCLLSIIALAGPFNLFCEESKDTPKLSKESQQAIDKAIEAQLAPASKAYDAYQKALQDVQGKVIASLEKLKADTNDTKKGSMNLKDRANLIDAIEARIADIKKGDLNEIVVAKSSADMLGEHSDPKLAFVGEWVRDNMKDHFILNPDGSISWGLPVNYYKGNWKLERNKIVFTWTEHNIMPNQVYSISRDKNTLTGDGIWILKRLTSTKD